MKPFAFVILAIGLFLPCIAGCSQAYRFEGVVVDGQGIGVMDANIIFYPHDQEKPQSEIGQMTKQDGTFDARWSGGPGVKFFRMIVSKTGYDADERIVLADEKDIRVVLSVPSGKVK